MRVHLFNPLLIIGYVGQHQPIPKGQLCQKYSAYGFASIQPVHPVAGCQHCCPFSSTVVGAGKLAVLYCSDTYKAEWEISVNFHVSKISLHWFFFKIVWLSPKSQSPEQDFFWNWVWLKGHVATSVCVMLQLQSRYRVSWEDGGNAILSVSGSPSLLLKGRKGIFCSLCLQYLM